MPRNMILGPCVVPVPMCSQNNMRKPWRFCPTRRHMQIETARKGEWYHIQVPSPSSHGNHNLHKLGAINLDGRFRRSLSAWRLLKVPPKPISLVRNLSRSKLAIWDGKRRHCVNIVQIILIAIAFVWQKIPSSRGWIKSRVRVWNTNVLLIADLVS